MFSQEMSWSPAQWHIYLLMYTGISGLKASVSQISHQLTIQANAD